jgi:hypothetical protein
MMIVGDAKLEAAGAAKKGTFRKWEGGGWSGAGCRRIKPHDERERERENLLYTQNHNVKTVLKFKWGPNKTVLQT